MHVSVHFVWSNTFDLSFPGLSAGHHSPPLSLADEVEKVGHSLGSQSSSASIDVWEDRDQSSLSLVDSSDGSEHLEQSNTASSNRSEQSLGNTIATILSDDCQADSGVHKVSQPTYNNQPLLTSLYNRAFVKESCPGPDFRTCVPQFLHSQLRLHLRIALFSVVTVYAVWWLVHEFLQLSTGKIDCYNLVSPQNAGTVNIKYLNAYQDF